MKFGTEAEEAITDSRERTADTIFTDIESVAFAIESSDLNITEDNFVPQQNLFKTPKKGNW